MIAGYAETRQAVHEERGSSDSARPSDKLPPMRAALMVLALAPLALTACGGGVAGQTCPFGCPAAYLTANVVVTTTPAMAVNGVQAVLTGPVTGTMVCQPNFSALLCQWPPTVVVMPGTYSLEVSAPGYHTTTIQVEVAIPPPGTCGCSADSIKPSTVSISPTDGGVD